ncbi:hypothetical protein GEMRC1_007273 [Eukaryota sp. GEM-RC1]
MVTIPRFLTPVALTSFVILILASTLLIRDIRFFITGPKQPTVASTLCSPLDIDSLSKELSLSSDHIHRDLCDLGPVVDDDFDPQSLSGNLPRFPKFLWFVVDGWSRNHANQSFSDFAVPGASFLLNVPSLKYSHVIYTSLLTGTPMANYAGLPLTADNFIYSYVRANGKVKYLGPEWSLLAIHGQENYDRLFSTIELVSESHSIHFEHNFPTMFLPEHITDPSVDDYERLPPEEGSDLDHSITNNAHNLLDQLKQRNESLFAHSGVFDHVAHSRDFDFAERMSGTIARDMRRVADWVRKNPEYILIISSDHGIDQGRFSEVLHGYSSNGNSGILLLWSPFLTADVLKRGSNCFGTLKTCGERWIETVDNSPTLAPLINSMEIPFASAGISLSLMNDTKYELKLKYQNLIQLYRIDRIRKLSSSGMRNQAKEIFEQSFNYLNDDVTPTREFINQMDAVIFSFSNELMTMSSFPWHSLLLLLLGFSGLCYLLFLNNTRTITLWLMIGYSLFFPLMSLVLVYSAPEPHTLITGILLILTLILIKSYPGNDQSFLIELLIVNHVLSILTPLLIESFFDPLETFSKSSIGIITSWIFISALFLYFFKLESEFSRLNLIILATFVALITSTGVYHEISEPIWLDNGFNVKVLPVYILFGLLFAFLLPKITQSPRYFALFLPYYIFFASIHITIMRFSLIVAMVKYVVLYSIVSFFLFFSASS